MTLMLQLILGGARSGKSRLAEQIAQASEDATQSASESSRVAGEVSNQHEELTNTILSASEESAAIYKNIEEGQQELTAIRDLSDKTISESSTMKQNMEKLFDIISNMNEVIEGINSISSQTTFRSAVLYDHIP